MASLKHLTQVPIIKPPATHANTYFDNSRQSRYARFFVCQKLPYQNKVAEIKLNLQQCQSDEVLFALERKANDDRANENFSSFGVLYFFV